MPTHLDECFLAPRYFSHGKSRQTAKFCTSLSRNCGFEPTFEEKSCGNLRCLRWRILAQKLGPWGFWRNPTRCFAPHRAVTGKHISPCCQSGEHGAFPNGSSCARIECFFTRLRAELVENFVLTWAFSWRLERFFVGEPNKNAYLA